LLTFLYTCLRKEIALQDALRTLLCSVQPGFSQFEGVNSLPVFFSNKTYQQAKI